MEELHRYLELLLDHTCGGEGECADCRSLQRVYQLLEAEIFSCVLYTGTPPMPRPFSRERAIHSVELPKDRRATLATPGIMPPAA